LPTLSRTYVTAPINKALTTVVFYDNLGRAIQTLADNHLDTSPDRTSSQLDFTGRVLETKQNLRTLQIQTKQSYEIGGRLKSICQSINPSPLAPSGGTGSWEPINRNVFNDLGELTTKTLGCNLQTLDYAYTMRGWLNNINNPNSLVAEKDLFGMTLAYDNVGNISTWNYQNAQINAQTKAIENRGLYAYGFGYDGLNRILSANMTKNGTSTFASTNTYDLNGNTQTMTRTFNGTMVDNMAYTYAGATTGGFNQLQKIIDTGTNPTTGEFFKDGTANYTYDANGNLKTDSGKNISNISYNAQNLPTLINRPTGPITYLYTGTGQKLKADFGQGKKYDYIGNSVWLNDTLEFISTPEGRWTKAGFEYYLKDHLGNLRTSFACENGLLKVKQENHYDPWGLNLPIGVEGKDRYLYNGKEYQKDLGLYEYGFRWYSPDNTRFIQIDPLAEKMPSYSPYSFSFNNPVRFIDPDGRAPVDITLLGANNSSITVKTDLVDLKINASGLGVDFGGNYTLSGNDVLQAAVDIGGVFDPTGALDVFGAKMSYDKGDYWGAAASGFGAAVPYIGDLAKSGKIFNGIRKIENAIEAEKLGLEVGDKLASSSRGARREAMRDAGIPTSQQPLSQSKNASGREYTYEVPKNGGGKQSKSVQQQTLDSSHPGQNHWEAGKVRKDADGNVKMNNYGRPRLDNEKSKVNY
jgi:RHS repeat-associated protein